MISVLAQRAVSEGLVDARWKTQIPSPRARACTHATL